VKGRLVVAAFLLLPLVTACERTGALAPVTTVGNSPDSAGGAIIVARGDTAYTLSRRYNVPLRDLIETNRLTPPYKLEVGQRLVMPTSRQYIVQKGDTLYGISRMHNVDVSELTRINNLSPPYAVQAGQPLRLPGAGARSDAVAVAEAPSAGSGAASPGPVVGTAPVKQVSRGSIQATELPPLSGGPAPVQNAASAPVISTPVVSGSASAPVPGAKPTVTADAGGGMIYQPGQAPTSLRLPGQKPAPVVAEAPVARPVEIAPPPSPPPSSLAAAQPPQEVAAVPPPKPVEPEPAPRSSGRFLWPVKGKVVSGYGPKPDGMHNDGINIAARKGTPVVAVDNGVVAYAGNELRGFGNLLLVKHPDGFITAYAHLDRIDVERGASVKRGQAIGTVGQTGSVTSPQLHFELRKGSQAVDPRDRLDGNRVSEGASRDGQPGPG